MSILKRLSNGEDDGGDDLRQPGPSRPDPEIIRGRPGYASFSLAALRERIEGQIEEELARRADVRLEMQDEEARWALVREVGGYVLAVESVPLSHAEREALFTAVYRDLFTFGPLDALLSDETITGLTIDGFERVYVRRLSGESEQIPSIFEDHAHLLRSVERILAEAGGQLLEEEPFVEVGLVMLGRPARLSLVMPPLNPVLHLELRLHPSATATLHALQAGGAITEADATLLRALMRSPHGALIVGEAGAGKTTLLEALLSELPDPGSTWLVERGGELRPPQGVQRLGVIPAREGQPGVDFPAQVRRAVDENPTTLVLDELLGDEAGVLWEALTRASRPRCLFVLRGSSQPQRLRSALRILLRKGRPDAPQEAINRLLLERLPFVITTRLGPQGVQVDTVAEWVEDAASADDVILRPLLHGGRPTGHRPHHAVAVDAAFWER